MMNRATALLVIDLQCDYFPGGKFPLWEAEACQARLVETIRNCRRLGMPVIFIRHVAAGETAPFFVPGSAGTELTAAIRAAAPDAPVVEKHFADSFYQTTLEATLQKLGVEKLLVAGMMTQNCVTFTALSEAAAKYRPVILSDCCTTVSEMIHLIALNALAIRVPLRTAAEALTGR